MSMKRKLINFAANSVHGSGIQIYHQEVPYHKVWKFIVKVVFQCTMLASLLMYCVINHDNIQEVMTTFPILAIVLIVLGAYVITFCHKKTISKLFHRMDTFYEYPDDELIEVEYKWYLQEENTVGLIRGIEYILYFIAAVFYFPFFANLWINGSTDSFVYPCWTPWKLDDAQWQFFTLVVQAIQGLCALWCNYNSAVCVSVFLCDFIVQYKKLNGAVKSLKHRTICVVLADKKLRNSFDDVMRRNIIHCIIHHQKLHKNFRLFNIWFSEFFSWTLAICMLSLAFEMFLAAAAPNVLWFCYHMGVLLITNTFFFILCILGEIFSNLNYELADAIFYETEWFEASKENRRLLLIFHALTCRPFCLKGFSIYPANCETFGRIIKSTYSAFTSLKIAMKKKYA